jgi:hypothetical protein
VEVNLGWFGVILGSAVGQLGLRVAGDWLGDVPTGGYVLGSGV